MGRIKGVGYQPRLQSPFSVPEKLEGYRLYKKLELSGFPQGGVGNWKLDKDGENKVYVPHPSEVYQQFVSDPAGWEEMADAMVRVWIKWEEKRHL